MIGEAVKKWADRLWRGAEEEQFPHKMEETQAELEQSECWADAADRVFEEQGSKDAEKWSRIQN